MKARERKLTAAFAASEADIREAQRLRYEVFHDECGARLAPSSAPGLDQDDFDPHCRHLLVRDEADGSRVVGAYRLLTPEGARNAGRYYSETEFDLGRLAPLRPRMLEIGRSCVHRDYRSGAVIALLWSGIIQFMIREKLGYLVGCTSLSLEDGGQMASNQYAWLAEKHLAPPELRVRPLHPFALRPPQGPVVPPPPLIKGYLRTGAVICGEPAHDPDFNTADFFMLLSMEKLTDRYQNHLGRNA